MRAVHEVSLERLLAEGWPTKFAVIVPVHDAAGEARIVQAARALVERGCTEFVLWGARHDAVHDAVDEEVADHEPVILTVGCASFHEADEYVRLACSAGALIAIPPIAGPSRPR